MKPFSKFGVLFVWLVIFVFGSLDLSPSIRTAFAYKLDGNKVLWKHLAYKGKSFFGKVKTEVFLTISSADELQKILLPVPEFRGLQIPNSRVISITVQSTIIPLIGSNHYIKSQAWMIPEIAASLQRIRLRRGGDTWQKSYRFTDKGVYRLRKKPIGANEINLTPEQWTQEKEAFYPYSLESLECSEVLEPTGLLYLVSAVDFEKQQSPLSLCVFNKKQLHRVKVFSGGDRQLKVNYREKTRNMNLRTQKSIETVKISFKPHSLVPGNTNPEEFSFLGLKGDFDIYVDKASRIPVQVSGQISRIGKVHIRLHAVEF